MSQAHKNRIKSKFQKEQRSAIEDWSRVNKQSVSMAEASNKNPKLNPSGRNAYKADPYFKAPKGKEEIAFITTPVYTPGASLKPDARHAARIRGNKARGTQSSATRVPVK